MPGHGRGGKPKAGFPPRPQPLEIANCAIPTFPPPRRSNGKVENQKQVFHFPTAYDLPWMAKLRKEPWRPAASLPPPGSFLDEKMLCYKTKVGRMRDPIGSRPPVRKFSL